MTDEDGTDADARAQPSAQLERAAPIVGVGASAGGVDALQRLFRLVEPDCGMSFVVVQHLDPHAKSILPELLARASRLDVKLITDGMTVEPNTIYVIPPDATLTIEKRRLKLSTPPDSRGPRTAVDSFLLSLAEDQGEDAACIILTGTGSDGTLGLRAVKEHGGLTLAQADAEYDGMMRSAVTTGMVDELLPLEQIPAKLTEYFRHLKLVGEKIGKDGVWPEAMDYLGQICGLLRTRTGHDFQNYKERTLVRRVQRRMQVLQIIDVPAFIERLRQDPKEVDALLQDLLIGVTSFFRDPDAFEALAQEVIPRLFEGKGPDDAVRVWVAGCATGEEAYSIAILLREHAPQNHKTMKLQIFASDIDEHALEVARAGRFPATIAKDVKPQWLERYFVREDGTYRVITELREICLFTMHDLLRDAPFSKLDLISCRNLLIYLKSELQDRVIPLFHYALRPNGFLFLGSSENVSRHTRLFSVVDKGNRVFRRRQVPERRLPEFPLTTPDARPHKPGAVPHPGVPDGSLQALAERQILDRYAPPFVIVTAEGELLHSSARTGKFLELPAGAPDTSIFNLARRGLKLELRAALHRATSTGQIASLGNLRIGTNGGQQAIDLFVQPLRQSDAQDRAYLIVFKELGGIKLKPEEHPPSAVEEVESVNVQRLEAELRETRERLQTTTEELESSNEELKSSNEELSSMNEELQSTNEELETSREELQSINEELQTVNSELSARVDELSRSHSDMVNLLANTQIATLFLDRDLRVQSFTPTAKDLFRLVESDTGRPITHLRASFEPESLEEDAERVLRTLATIEREVRSTARNATYIMRVLPYRSVDNVISGVVITFIDITRISAAEARITELARDLRYRLESLETLLGLVPIGIFIMEENDGEHLRVNRRGADLIGEPVDMVGLKPMSARLRLRVNGEDVTPENHPMRLAVTTGKPVSALEAELVRPDGTAIAVIFSATPLFNEAGQARGAVAAAVDISERKAAEDHRQMLMHELQHRVKNILATVGALATRLLQDNAPPEVFKERFLGRLQAMGRIHDLLSQGRWQGTDLRELVSASLASHVADERSAVDFDGPAVLLPPEPSATMGMVLHELATNAAKYGALSSADGQVHVTWRTEAADGTERLVLCWREQGGPPVSTPPTEGFGLRFVRRSVEYELAGTVENVFDVNGFQSTIKFPLVRQVNAGGAAR